MTKQITTLITGLIALVTVGVGCIPTPDTPALPQHPAIVDNELGEYFAPEPAADEPRAVVVVDASNTIVDVQPPTRLDVRGVERGECDRMGGQYVGPETSGSLGTCEGVDY